MKNSTRLLLFMALLKICLPFILQNSFYEPHRDEFLYLSEGQHLAWGYMEAPPILSIFAWLTHLFGKGFFWIKFWPALIGAITLFITGKIAEEMGGKLFAVFLTALGFFVGAYVRVHFLFQPNSLDIFCWTWCAYLLVRYINSNHPRYIYWLGVAVGIGWLSKYSIIFFGAGIAGGLLLTPHRKIFLQKHIYLAVAFALLIALPNLLWQYNHNWPVVAHMKELREQQLRFINPADFIKGQILMNLPFVFIWIGGLIWLLFFKNARPYRLLGWIYIIVIAALIATSGKDYYALGAYPMLFAAGGVWVEQITAGRIKWFRYAAAALPIILFIPILPVALPVWKPEKLAAYYHRMHFDKIGILRWEDLKEHPLPQDFADMIAWKEMTAKAAGVYNSLSPEEKKQTMVYCRSYCSAGALNYYGRAMGLPEVYSDDASFLLWMPDTYNIKNLIFVGHKIPGKDDIVFQQFEKMTVRDSLTNPLARETGMKIIIFENGNAQLNGLIEKGIKEMKGDFTR